MDYSSFLEGLRSDLHVQLIYQIGLLSERGLGFNEIASVCQVTPVILRRIFRCSIKLSVPRYFYTSHLINEYFKLHSER